MKKTTIFFLSLVLLCSFLCSCDPLSYSIDREKLNNVVCVDLIQYENPNQKEFITWVPNQFDKLVPFILDNATVIETLQEERIPDFLDVFSESDILDTYYAYNSPKDVCLRLTNANGDFLIVWANYAESSSAGYIGEYSADGSVLSFWGSFSSLYTFKTLVNQFFDYKLP